MTWGSNASFGRSRCRFCGRADVDDRAGLSSHEVACFRRGDRRLARLAVGVGVAAFWLVCAALLEARVSYVNEQCARPSPDASAHALIVVAAPIWLAVASQIALEQRGRIWCN